MNHNLPEPVMPECRSKLVTGPALDRRQLGHRQSDRVGARSRRRRRARRSAIAPVSPESWASIFQASSRGCFGVESTGANFRASKRNCASRSTGRSTCSSRRTLCNTCTSARPPCRAAKINRRRRRALRATGRQQLRNNHETESTHNCGGAAPHPRHGSREKLETLGTLSLRAAMGNGARGLFGLGELLGLLPPRSCAQPRVSLGRGRPAGHHRSAVPALLCVGALERQRPDLERAALRPDGLRGQPRRGREGMLLLPRFDADAFLHEGALQIPSGGISVRAARRGKPAARTWRDRV